MLVSILVMAVDGGLAPTLKTKPISQENKLDSNTIVSFTKTLYKELGDNWGNSTAVADKFHDEFVELNSTSDGQLGSTLSALLEIRMSDLQASIRHAKKMRSVILEFTKENTVK
jgi:hypothetical protein